MLKIWHSEQTMTFYSGGRYEIGHLSCGRSPPGPHYVRHRGWWMTHGDDKNRDQRNATKSYIECRIRTVCFLFLIMNGTKFICIKFTLSREAKETKRFESWIESIQPFKSLIWFDMITFNCTQTWIRQNDCGADQICTLLTCVLSLNVNADKA